MSANHRHADLSARDRAIADFAVKVAQDSAAIEAADLDALSRQGFNQSDIWDIAAIASFFSLSNRMANVAAIRPNPEFYTMGRGETPGRGDTSSGRR